MTESQNGTARKLTTIGLRGLHGSGKTTIAIILRERLQAMGYAAVILPFAKPLRDGLAVMGITKQNHPDLYRTAAQYLGTDIVRAHHPNWWVNQWQKACEAHAYASVSKPVIIVADDVRFENERDCLDWVFYVQAGRFRRSDPDVEKHSSEHLNMKPGDDTIIHNEPGSVQDAVAEIIQAMDLKPAPILIRDPGDEHP